MNLITDPKSLTDFEKLMFANAYIKELKALLTKAEMDIGILKGEIQEMIDLNGVTKKCKEQKQLIRTLENKLHILCEQHERLLMEKVKTQTK